MTKPKRVITGLRLFTVSLAKAGTGKNRKARIVLAKAGVNMSPEEMAAALDQLKASLSEEQLALVMALIEASKAPAAEPAAKADPEDEEPAAKADPPPAEDEEPAAKADPEEDEKMAALRKAHDDALAAERARAEAAEAEIAKRDEATRLSGFVAKAANDMGSLPGITSAELGTLLASTATVLDDKQMGQLQGVLQGASAAIAKSALLKAQGSSGDQASPASQLDHEINVLRKAHPELSPQQALVRVQKSNPALFKAASEER